MVILLVKIVGVVVVLSACFYISAVSNLLERKIARSVHYKVASVLCFIGGLSMIVFTFVCANFLLAGPLVAIMLFFNTYLFSKPEIMV